MYSNIGRPKKDLSEKKSHVQSQSDYAERKKQEIGEKEYNAMRAKQRAESRARCWARKSEEEREAVRLNQRKRAHEYACRKVQVVKEEIHVGEIDGDQFGSPNTATDATTLPTPVASNSSIVTNIEHFCNLRERTSKDVCEKKLEARRQAEYVKRRKQEMGEKEYKAMRARQKAESRARCLARKSEEENGVHHVSKGKKACTHASGKAQVLEEDKDQDQFGTPHIVTDATTFHTPVVSITNNVATTPSTPVMSDSNTLTAMKYSAKAGRPRKDPSEKKSHVQSQVDYAERKKQEMGEKEYKAMRARQKAESRARCLARKSKEKKGVHHVNKGKRACTHASRKAQLLKEDKDQDQFGTPHVVTDATTLPTHVVSNSIIILTDMKYYSNLARPRRDPSEKKSHVQSQSDYAERKKQEIGEKEYNAMRARQWAESRARCWARKSEEEKEAHLLNQRKRVHEHACRKAQVLKEEIEDIDGDQFDSPNTVRDATTLSTPIVSNSTLTDKEHFCNLGERPTCSKDLCKKKCEARRQAEYVKRKKQEMGEKEYKAMRARQKAESRARCLARKSEEVKEAHHVNKRKKALTYSCQKAIVFKGSTEGAQVDAPPAVTDATTLPAPVFSNSNLLTDTKYYSNRAKRPKKDTSDKKSAAQIQAKYAKRKKQKMGAKEYNAMKARQKAESRARCWARKSEEEREAHRLNQRKRAHEHTFQKAQVFKNEVEEIDGDQFGSPNTVTDATTLSTHIVSNSSILTDKEHYSNLGERPTCSKDLCKKKREALRQVEYVNRKKQEMGEKEYKAMRARQKAESRARCLARKSEEDKEAHHAKRKEALTYSCQKAKVFKGSTEGAQVDAPPAVTDATTLPALVVPNSNLLTDTKYYSNRARRPKKVTSEKKSAAQIQAKYAKRKKQKMGEKEYKAMRARQKAESRARCWARKSEEEREVHRLDQRKRADEYRCRKAQVLKEDIEGDQFGAPLAVTVATTPPTPVVSNSNTLTAMIYSNKAGRPRKDPSEKKSHVQSQAEYAERKKQEVGQTEYKARMAKQRAASRARCWARKSQEEKEAHRANQRMRAHKHTFQTAQALKKEIEGDQIGSPLAVTVATTPLTPVVSNSNIFTNIEHYSNLGERPSEDLWTKKREARRQAEYVKRKKQEMGEKEYKAMRARQKAESRARCLARKSEEEKGVHRTNQRRSGVSASRHRKAQKFKGDGRRYMYQAAAWTTAGPTDTSATPNGNTRGNSIKGQVEL